MAVKFDYTTTVQNVFHIIKDAAYSSEVITNPADEVFFTSLIDPGHTGSTTSLEYYFDVTWLAASAPATLAYKWQYKPVSGSWTDLVTGNAVASSTGTFHKYNIGVYTVAVTLPIEVRLIGTDADNSWRVNALATTACLMRAIGTVS